MNLSFMQEKLKHREARGNLRQLSLVNQLVDFASNDYLGFSHCHHLQLAVEQEMAEWRGDSRTGATGSRLLTGNSTYYEKLEEWIAQFHRAEAGLIFNSGYLANLGLLSAVVNSDDTILYDVAIHASTQEGAQLSRARCVPWRHHDLHHLEKQLQKVVKETKRIFVCIESIYSIDGTCTALKEICRLCQKYDAYLIVDEAHATGVFGEQGRGLVVAHQLEKKIFARIHTFSKALGTAGAIVVGNSILRDYLINYARSFIYTTALPLSHLISIKCAYEKLLKSSAIAQLCENQLYFEQQVQDLNLPISSTKTPIHFIPIKGNEHARLLAKSLQAAGYDVRALLSPTVRRSREGLRLCLHSFNTKDQIDGVLTHLTTHLRDLK